MAAACAAKGLDPRTTEAGEELFVGIGTFVRMARLLRDAVRDIANEGKPSFAGPVRQAPDGRLRVQVFPATAFDRITFPQTTAEVWMQPGVTRESLAEGQALAYADPPAHAGTALVLAAGNVASLGPRDVLSKLFVDGKVVVMKANPVNDYLVPHWKPSPRLADRRRRTRHRRGRRCGRAVSHRSRADRRGAHHRVGQDLRRRRVRHRRRRCPAQGRRRARAGQSGDGGAGQRVAGDRGAREVVDPRTAVSGRARGQHAGQQCGLQLHLGPGPRHARRLAPSAMPSWAR